MGDWVLYAAAIVGAWTAASATISLAEALGKKKDRLSGGSRKAVRQNQICRMRTLSVYQFLRECARGIL